MTTLARRVAAVPVRTSVETWRAICELLTPPGSDARTELGRATTVAAVLIAEEYTSAGPIVAIGSGPRVKVYTVHGEEAQDVLREESPLPSSPCGSDGWEISLPCAADDLEEMQSALQALPHLSVRLPDAEPESATVASNNPTPRPRIDLHELGRP